MNQPDPTDPTRPPSADEPGVIDRAIVDRASAERVFAALQARAVARGIVLRAPPPVPTTCCGRGCNGCVWEGYCDAAAWWHEDALAALDGAAAGTAG